MSDISVTASAIKAANANTVVGRGTAGAAVAAGQAVFADPADSYRIKPAIATNETQADNVVGIALNSASADQPVAYASAGDVTFNNVLTAAGVYVLGDDAAGGIAPSADLDATTNTNYGTVLGIATSGTNLRVGIIASGVKNP